MSVICLINKANPFIMLVSLIAFCIVVSYSPRTISCDTASVKPWSFLIFILISPVSLLWHLIRSKRLWLADFSILTLLSSCSSSPSLYHWTLIGLWPMNCSLKMALCPTLSVKGLVKALRSSESNLGGSKNISPIRLISEFWHYYFFYWQSIKPLMLIIASVLRPSASKRYFPECSTLHCIITNLWMDPSIVIEILSSGYIC